MKHRRGAWLRLTLAAVVAGAIGLVGESTGAALPSPASANPGRSAAGDLTSAKKHYRDGQTKFQAGDFAGALADFEIANDVKATAQAQRYIGRCLDALGQYPEALEWYEKFLAHVPGKMKAQAEKTRARVAEIRAASVQSGPVAEGPSGSSALAASTADGSRGQATPSREPTIGDRDILDVRQTRADDRTTAGISRGAMPPGVPPPAGAPPLVTGATAPAAPPRSSERRSQLAATISAVAAVAAAGVGTAFGIIALEDKARFEAHDTPQNAATRNEHALISNIAFGNAFALGGASLVLFVMGQQNPQELEPTASALSKKAGPEAASRAAAIAPAPLIGPHAGGASVLVRF